MGYTRKMLPLVQHYIDEYEEDYKPNSQVKAVLGRLAEDWDGQRPNRSATSIDHLWVSKWIRTAYTGYADGTKRKYESIVRTFLTWGYDNGKFESGAQAFKTAKRGTGAEKKAVYLTAQQMKYIWEGLHPHHRGLFSFVALTMLRGNEVVALRVRDVIWEHGVIDVRRFKTRSNGFVTMDNDLIRELKLYMAAYEQAIGKPVEPNMYLFPQFDNLNSQNLWMPDVKRSRLCKVIKRLIVNNLPKGSLADEDKKGLGGHTLRRSMAKHSHLLFSARGMADPLGAVKGRLGHKSRSTTEIYISAEADQIAEHEAYGNISLTGGDEKIPTLRIVPDRQAG